MNRQTVEDREYKIRKENARRGNKKYEQEKLEKKKRIEGLGVSASVILETLAKKLVTQKDVYSGLTKVTGYSIELLVNKEKQAIAMKSYAKNEDTPSRRVKYKYNPNTGKVLLSENLPIYGIRKFEESLSELSRSKGINVEGLLTVYKLKGAKSWYIWYITL